MQQAKAITKRITTNQAEIARLDGEIERCNAAITAGEQHATALVDLRRRRAEEVATAFVEHRAANVAPIEKEISAAEKLHASSVDQATAARGGLQIIESRCSELRAELAAARAELKEAILEEIKERAEKASSAFNAAVDGLRAPLAELRALDSAAAMLRGVVNQYSQSQQMLNALAEEGLRVFTPRGFGGPSWLRNLGSTEVYESLVTEFRAMGLDV